MAKDMMTSKGRIQATLERKEKDRVPFWPKLGERYSVYQEDRFKNCSNSEIHKFIGSDPVNFAGLDLVQSNEKVVIRNIIEKNQSLTIYETPEGKLTERQCFDERIREWHPIEYPIKSIQDVRRARYIFEKTSYSLAEGASDRHLAQINEYGDDQFVLTTTGGLSPLMDLQQFKMGLENCVYLLYDYPEELEELMQLMHEDYIRRLEVILQVTPLRYIMSVENTSTNMITPSQFEKYSMQHLTDYGKLMGQYGKDQVLHMCGMLKDILPLVDRVPAVSIEAFSSPPIGDTTISDGFTFSPSKVLIGGSCANTWLMDEKDIIDKILYDIREAGTKEGLLLSSGGEMPPAVSPEKIKSVWESIKNEL